MFPQPSSDIERELSPGEKLLWCGFALFWEYNVINQGAPFFFMLWGIPFVLIGLYVVLGRFFVDAKLRERTFYGVTNERILIVRGLFSRQTKSLPLRTLSDLSLTERADGSGTITLGPSIMPFMQSLPGGWPGADKYSPPAFDLIERVKEIYELIRQAQRIAK